VADWPKGEGIIPQTSPDQMDVFPAHLCLLHHDADHGFAVVHRDLEFWGKLVLPGGIIALHDYHEPTYPDVKASWEQFSLKDKFKYWGRGHSVQIFERM